jgi:hypothetical protein
MITSANLIAIEKTLKRSLVPGTQMFHRHLGDCVFTEACKQMELVDGSIDTLYIEHDDELKEVTLNLMCRYEDSDESKVQMHELTPRTKALLEAVFVLIATGNMPSSPTVLKIIDADWAAIK